MPAKKYISPQELAETLLRKRKPSGYDMARAMLLATIIFRKSGQEYPQEIVNKAWAKILKMPDERKKEYDQIRQANESADANRAAYARCLREGKTACNLVTLEDEAVFMATSGKAEWPEYDLRQLTRWTDEAQKVERLNRLTDHWMKLQAIFHELSHRKAAHQIAGEVLGLPDYDAMLASDAQLIEQAKERNRKAAAMLEKLKDSGLEEEALELARDIYSPVITEGLEPEAATRKKAKSQLTIKNFQEMFCFVPDMLNVDHIWEPDEYEEAE